MSPISALGRQHMADLDAKARAHRAEAQVAELADRIAGLEQGDGVWFHSAGGDHVGVVAWVRRDDDTDEVLQLTVIEVGIHGQGAVYPGDGEVELGRWWWTSHRVHPDAITDVIPHRSSQMLGNVARRLYRALAENTRSMGWTRGEHNVAELANTLRRRAGQP